MLFEEAGVSHVLAKKHAKKFHRHGMEITFLVPDLKYRLRDCLCYLKAEEAHKKKIESARCVEKYLQDLRAKEAEEKNEQNWINAKPTANHIDSGYEGDNETVDDEAFIQFEKPMDVELSVEDVV